MLKLIEDLGMLYPTEFSKKKVRFGLYKCYCGNEFKTQILYINNGHTSSCGCFRKQKTKETKTKHGFSSHRLYKTWKGMIQRCTNQKNEKYKDYGARGITVCERWLDINNFIEDMYHTFQEGLTLDRKNNNKGYYKDNCRWTTKCIQSRNIRTLSINNTSGFKGVTKHGSKFRAKICINNKQIHIGLFKTAIEAAKAYDQYVIDNNLEHTKNFN